MGDALEERVSMAQCLGWHHGVWGLGGSVTAFPLPRFALQFAV